MSLLNSLKKRMTNQFLSIIIYNEQCNIKQKIIKNAKMIHKEEFNFDLKSNDELGGKVINFINDLQAKYDNTYIALFLNTLGQGLIPGCDESDLEKFHIDKNGVKSICKEGRFLMYATHIDIKWADNLFKKTGLDFIFSPFLVLDHFIKKEMSKDSFNKDIRVLYILNTKNGFTLMIQQDQKVLYGAFYSKTKDENLLYTNYEDEISESDEMEELDLDTIDELGMDDILDTASQGELVEGVLSDSVALSEEDEKIVKYLNSSLKEFYSNELYDSDFICTAKIFDDVGIGEGVVKYIENDLLLNTTVEDISVSDAVLDLSIKEALNIDV